MGPGPVWTGEKSRPHRDSIPDRPARSSVAIPTEIPGLQDSSVAGMKLETNITYNYWHMTRFQLRLTFCTA